MLIAAISDIHDRTDNLMLVLEEIRQHGCNRIACMGDICEPASLRELGELTRGIPVDIVFGNNDEEEYALRHAASKFENMKIYGHVASYSPGGFRLALTHYPMRAGQLARTGEFDAVLCGHSHQASVTHIGTCLLANPGEVEGTRSGRITYGILDTTAGTFIIHTLIFRA